MGGNALKKTKTRRYKADEYFELKDKVLEALQSILPDVRMEDVKAYGSKPDFGDLDVVIENLDAKNRLEPALSQLGISEVVRNGPVWSLGWGDFQVDLIFQSPDNYDFARYYFAFNDLGNLIGRIARRFDLKFGHDGLWYMFRDGNYKIADINLTKDFDQALEFLGYSPERFHQGFDSLDEIFHFVTTSPYYDHQSFLLHNRSHKARVRDAKRPSYRAFLRYAEANANQGPLSPLTKEEGLQKACEWFPEFSEKLSEFEAKHERNKAAKEKFNGDLVSRLTGLTGKELGAFMTFLKSTFSNDKDQMNTWIVDNTHAMIESWIQSQHKRFCES